MEADFEILASMYNPNRFDLRVSSGTGVFRHENREVGCHVNQVHCLDYYLALILMQNIRCLQFIDADNPRWDRLLCTTRYIIVDM